MDLVSTDFRITQTLFLAVEHQSTPVNTDEVAHCSDVGRERQVVYCCITYSVLATTTSSMVLACWLIDLEMLVH